MRALCIVLHFSTQKFGSIEKTIRKHINNVFSDNEVPKAINTHFLRVDGVKQPVAFYTLDVIISVGIILFHNCNFLIGETSF